MGRVWFDILRLCKWKYPRQGVDGSYDGECGCGDGGEFHFWRVGACRIVLVGW